MKKFSPRRSFLRSLVEIQISRDSSSHDLNENCETFFLMQRRTNKLDEAMTRPWHHLFNLLTHYVVSEAPGILIKFNLQCRSIPLVIINR